MGEYANYKGEQVKIGTCEDMYYLRYDQRAMVQALPGNVNPVRDASMLRFRLPFTDEAGTKPGYYDQYNRGIRLCRTVDGTPEDWSDENLLDHPGSLQVRNVDAGLIGSIPCFHGMKLPDGKWFWNGKNHSFELTSARPDKTRGMLGVITCRHCREAWGYPIADLLAWVPDETMRETLRKWADEARAL